MPEIKAVEQKVVDGVVCHCCSLCGDILVRIESRGLLGEDLNFLDIMVIKDHYFSKHEGEYREKI